MKSRHTSSFHPKYFRPRCPKSQYHFCSFIATGFHSILLWTRAVIIPVLDPNPDSELRRFLTFFNSNSNSESSCYIVLDPNPDSELWRFLTFYRPNSNSKSGKKRNNNSSSQKTEDNTNHGYGRSSSMKPFPPHHQDRLDSRDDERILVMVLQLDVAASSPALSDGKTYFNAVLFPLQKVEVHNSASAEQRSLL